MRQSGQYNGRGPSSSFRAYNVPGKCYEHTQKKSANDQPKAWTPPSPITYAIGKRITVAMDRAAPNTTMHINQQPNSKGHASPCVFLLQPEPNRTTVYIPCEMTIMSYFVRAGIEIVLLTKGLATFGAVVGVFIVLDTELVGFDVPLEVGWGRALSFSCFERSSRKLPWTTC